MNRLLGDAAAAASAATWQERQSLKLHQAIRRGDARDCQALLSDSQEQQILNPNHVSVAQKATHNRVPLHLAVLGGHSQVCQVLLNQPTIRVNVRDRDNATPLALAAKGGHENICKDLLKAGADPNIITNHGVSALHYAVERQYENICRILLHAGADPNTKTTPQGDTPLHVATRQAYLGIVELLVGYGASLETRNAQGQTPIFAAHAQGGGGAIMAKKKWILRSPTRQFAYW